MERQKNLNLKAIEEKKNIASSVNLKISSNHEIPFDLHQLEKLFLQDFDSHAVKKGTQLVLKYLGKKWKIIIEDVCRNYSTEPDDYLTAEMGSLKIDHDCQSSQSDTYLLILSNTKVTFNTPNKDGASVLTSVGLSDFGGSHEVVQEITKLCQSVFKSSTTVTTRGMIFLSSQFWTTKKL